MEDIVYSYMMVKYRVKSNSVYGSMGDKNNALYDPRNLHAVCANGQLMIMDLADKLTDKCKIIQLIAS